MAGTGLLNDCTSHGLYAIRKHKTVFCRIGDRLRIAGLADIAPGQGVFKPERFETLFKTAREIFPKAGDYDGEVNAWTGLRPVTPNSQPMLGARRLMGSS